MDAVIYTHENTSIYIFYTVERIQRTKKCLYVSISVMFGQITTMPNHFQLSLEPRHGRDISGMSVRKVLWQIHAGYGYGPPNEYPCNMAEKYKLYSHMYVALILLCSFVMHGPHKYMRIFTFLKDYMNAHRQAQREKPNRASSA